MQRRVHRLLAAQVEHSLHADLVDVNVVQLRDAHEGVEYALANHLSAIGRLHQNIEENLSDVQPHNLNKEKVTC